MDLASVRAAFPQYNDIPDVQLLDRLHEKFYSDLPREEFYGRMGVQAPPVQAPPHAQAPGGLQMMSAHSPVQQVQQQAPQMMAAHQPAQEDLPEATIPQDQEQSPGLMQRAADWFKGDYPMGRMAKKSAYAAAQGIADTAQGVAMPAEQRLRDMDKMSQADIIQDIGRNQTDMSNLGMYVRQHPDVPQEQAVRGFYRRMLQQRVDSLKSVSEAKGLQMPEDLQKPAEGASGAYQFMENTVSGMAGFAPNMALMAVPGAQAAGVMAMFEQLRGGSYKEMLDKGVDPDRAYIYSTLNSLGQTPLESVGDLIQIGFIKKAISGRGAKFLYDFLRSATSEGVENAAQEVPDLVANIYAQNPDVAPEKLAKKVVEQITSEDWLKSTGYQFATGAAGGGMMYGAGATAGKVAGKIAGEAPDLRTQEQKDIDETRQVDLMAAEPAIPRPSGMPGLQAQPQEAGPQQAPQGLPSAPPSVQPLEPIARQGVSPIQNQVPPAVQPLEQKPMPLEDKTPPEIKPLDLMKEPMQANVPPSIQPLGKITRPGVEPMPENAPGQIQPLAPITRRGIEPLPETVPGQVQPLQPITRQGIEPIQEAAPGSTEPLQPITRQGVEPMPQPEEQQKIQPLEPISREGIRPIESTPPEGLEPLKPVTRKGVDPIQLEEQAPIKPLAPIDKRAQEAATSPTNDLPEPTEAQKKAGNYKMGHIHLEPGLDIAIENPDGSIRTGTDSDGEVWENQMHGHYGYFKRTEGKDGSQIDVLVKPGTDAIDRAYVIDQVDPETGKFDEHKVILGPKTEEEARGLYLSNYEPGWQGLGAITEMGMRPLKKWLTKGKQTKPVFYGWKITNKGVEAPPSEIGVENAESTGTQIEGRGPQEGLEGGKGGRLRLRNDEENRLEAVNTEGQKEKAVGLPEAAAPVRNDEQIPERRARFSKGVPLHETTPAPPFSRRSPQTLTKAFKRWFGKSKVVDEKGEPLVVYHGTDTKFDEFKNKGGKVHVLFSTFDVPRQGFFFSPDSEAAGSFGKNVMPVYLSIKNPADFTHGIGEADNRLIKEKGYREQYLLSKETWEMFDEEDGKKFVQDLKDLGYDGAIIEEPAVEGEREQGIAYVAFSATQIKSATENRGTFSATEPSILMAKGKGGSENVPADQAGVYSAIDDLQRMAKKAAKSVVVQDQEQLPGHVLKAAGKDRVEAAWDPAKNIVYFVASNIKDPKRATELWMHEQVGHRGMLELFKDFGGGYNDFLDFAHSTIKRSNPVLYKEIYALYADPNLSESDQKRLITEEVIARRAERLSPRVRKRIFQRFLDFVNRWIKKAFGLSDDRFNLTMKDIDVLLEAAKNHIVHGEVRDWLEFKHTDEEYKDWAKEVLEKNPKAVTWYQNHVETLGRVFGKDAQLFSILLGATSPQTGVGSNTQFAIENYLYMAGHRDEPAGRYPSNVKKLMDRVRAGDFNFSNQYKVDEFIRALTGDPKATTNDMWMHRVFFGPALLSAGRAARIAETQAEVARGERKASEATTEKDYDSIFTVAENTASRHKLFQLAKELTDETDHVWSPREVQAAIWMKAKSDTEGLDLSKMDYDYDWGLTEYKSNKYGMTPLDYLRAHMPADEIGMLHKKLNLPPMLYEKSSKLERVYLKHLKENGVSQIDTYSTEPGADLGMGVHYTDAELNKGDYLVATPEGSRDFNSYSQSDIQGRMLEATETAPYADLVYFYETGTQPEPQLHGKSKVYNVSFKDIKIYDAIDDALDLREKAAKTLKDEADRAARQSAKRLGLNPKQLQVGKPSSAKMTNMLAKLVRDEGYDGFMVTAPTGERRGGGSGRWVLMFTKKAIDHVTTDATVGISDVVENIESMTQDIGEAAGQTGPRAESFRKRIDEIARHYNEVKVDGWDPAIARFGEATSGKLELSSMARLRGPAPAMKAFLAEVGIGHGQRQVYLMHTQAEPNGKLFQFRVKPEFNDASKLKAYIEEQGITDFNIVSTPSGLMVKQFVFKNDISGLDNFGRLLKDLCDPRLMPTIGDVSSEVLGDTNFSENPDDALGGYRQDLVDYFGESKGEEIYDEALQRRKDYLGEKGRRAGEKAQHPEGGVSERLGGSNLPKFSKRKEEEVKDLPSFKQGPPDPDNSESVDPNSSLIPENIRIDTATLSMMKGGLGFFESATDKLRRSGVPSLIDLANRTDRYFDQVEARIGWINGHLRPVLKGARKADIAAFGEYFRHHDNGREKEAQEVLADHPVAKKMGDAVQDVFDQIGSLNQQVGMQVYDPKIGGWRPIGKLARGKFWPRVFRPEVQAVLQNPTKDVALWGSLVDALVDEGHIKNRKDAAAYLLEYLNGGPNREIANDYFAGIEKARMRKLPEIFYDYSWGVFNRYARKWSMRVSQVEQFGQKTSQSSKDQFDRAMEEVFDKRTKEYIAALADRVYNRRPIDVYHSIMDALNLFATGAHLGNPATATLNLIGGQTLNWQMFGLKDTIKAHARLLSEWRETFQAGTELGIIGKDVLNIVRDTESHGADYMDTEGRVKASLSRFATASLKWGGYSGTEDIVRATSLIAANMQLRDALKAWNKPTMSRKGKKYAAFMQRNNIDVDKLIAENGQGPETARYLRRVVNASQGSYRVDQVPIFVDSPMGRFLFKYQKFNTQVSRMFWQQHLRPFLKGLSGGEKVTIRGQEHVVRDFTGLLRYFAGAFFGGTAMLTTRSFLFGLNDPGPDWDEIGKALQEDDRGYAWALIFSRAFHSLMAASAAGFFGNYIQFSMDVADQQRVKNPLDPPGLASIDAVAEVFRRLFEQKRLTARDLDQITERTFSLYRNYKRGLATIFQNTNINEFRLEMARRDVNETREIARRYFEDQGISVTRTVAGRFRYTERTPINKKIGEALLLGDAVAARKTIVEALKDAGPEGRAKMSRSMKTSARVRHPLSFGGVISKRKQLKFMFWAKENLPASKYQTIKDTVERFEKTGRAAGVFK